MRKDEPPACNGILPTGTTYPLSSVGSDSQTWDCNGAVETSHTDVNSNKTTYKYNDPLWRLTEVDNPDGGVTTTTYNTGASTPWTVSTCSTITPSSSCPAGTNSLTGLLKLDGLGRAIEKQTTSDPSGTDYQDVTYDTLGRVASRSNSYRTTSDPTYGITAYSYDALGRTTKVTNPDSTAKNFTYTGRATAAIDESGVERVYQVDGLGRLVTVCDGVGAGAQANGTTVSACNQDINVNGFLATYQYDALGNLLNRNFSGQGTQFGYDGLSRMTFENWPEVPEVSCQGGLYSKCYTYDSGTAGDLYEATFLNPKGMSVNATYSWDALHRLTTIQYSDGSAGYGYTYDASTWHTWNLQNGKGRLTSQGHTDGAAAAYSYDSMGRPIWEGSCAASNCYTTVNGINHGYDYAGNVVGITTTYTGGITYTRNAIGQITGVTSTWSDSTHPGTLWSGATYNPLGELASATYGDGVTRTNTYDTLGRLTEIQDGSAPTYRLFLNYYPNSTISSYQDNVTGRWNYTYDAFNRLATANLTQTGNNSPPHYTYSYDQFGNRWHQDLASGTGYPVDYTYDAYNHNPGFTYDWMGNVIGDSICGTKCWAYDDAGQMATGNGASYLYDAAGRRQQKTDPGTGGTVHSFVYDGDSVYTEFTPGFARQTGGFYTYANGTTYFNRADNLGTPRLSTDYTGAVERKEGVLMGPFGDNFTETLSTLDYTGFAGGFWDAENNGDHFGAREYQATHGSWLTPDPAGLASVDITNPQTWNRYAYVTNNPLSMTDPLGLAGSTCPIQGLPVCQGGYFNGLSLLLSLNNGTPVNWDSLAILSYTTDVIVGWMISGNCDNCRIPLTEQQTFYYVSVAPNGSPCTLVQVNPCSGTANNGQNPQPQPPKPQAPCYASNSLTDKAVRTFSLLRLAETWEEWVVGGAAKISFFGVAQAGARSAGGAESLGAAAIGTTGQVLGVAGSAATIGATMADINCQIGPVEPYTEK